MASSPPMTEGEGAYFLHAFKLALAEAFRHGQSRYAHEKRNRTHPKRGPKIVYVKNFGAVCDGVTDDTKAFQRAIDALHRRAERERAGMHLPKRLRPKPFRKRLIKREPVFEALDGLIAIRTKPRRRWTLWNDRRHVKRRLVIGFDPAAEGADRQTYMVFWGPGVCYDGEKFSR